jgi:hypothetical protein
VPAGDSDAILTCGALALHVCPHPALDAADFQAGCHMRVADVDGLHAAMARLPAI